MNTAKLQTSFEQSKVHKLPLYDHQKALLGNWELTITPQEKQDFLREMDEWISSPAENGGGGKNTEGVDLDVIQTMTGFKWW